MLDRPHLRPLDLSDLLDESLALYRANFVLLAGIVAVLVVPEAIINALVTITEPTTTVRLANGLTQTTTSSAAGTALISIISVVFSILTIGALSIAVSFRYLRRPISIGEAYRRVGVARFMLLAVGSLVAAMCITVGFIFLVIPGIFLLVRWLFLAQAIVIENTSIRGGFRRSWNLVRGSFWRVFGYGIILVVIVAIIQFALGALIGAALSFGGSSGTRALGVFLTAAIGIVVSPFEFTALTLLYYDLRVRKEGFDLVVMSTQFDAGPVA